MVDGQSASVTSVAQVHGAYVDACTSAWMRAWTPLTNVFPANDTQFYIRLNTVDTGLRGIRSYHEAWAPCV